MALGLPHEELRAGAWLQSSSTAIWACGRVDGRDDAVMVAAETKGASSSSPTTESTCGEGGGPSRPPLPDRPGSTMPHAERSANAALTPALVFNRYKLLHPEADQDIERPAAASSAARRRSGALLRPCCRRRACSTFYFGLTLVPRSFQFPLPVKTFRKKSVMHYLGSDIRGKTHPRSSRSGRRPEPRSSARTTRFAGVPGRSSRPASTSRVSTPAPVSRSPGHPARAVFAPPLGYRGGDRGMRRARRRPLARRRPAPRGGIRTLSRSGHRRRSAERGLERSSRSSAWRSASRWSRSSTTRPAAHRGALDERVPIVREAKLDLPRTPRAVVASAAERRRIGAESRAYVERVHDLERVADRLLDLYSRL